MEAQEFSPFLLQKENLKPREGRGLTQGYIVVREGVNGKAMTKIQGS